MRRPALLGASMLLGAAAVALPSHGAGPDAPPRAGAPTATCRSPDFSLITRQYGASVVNISVSGTRKVVAADAPAADEREEYDATRRDVEDDPVQASLDRLRREFDASEATMQVPVQGQGSGFIVSDDGLVLTNAHVVANASDVVVHLADQRAFKARVLGSDGRTDIAVLKIDATDLPEVEIGDPARLATGEWVLAIGSPYGLENSVSVGVVSAKGRSLPGDSAVPLIQTDAAVNPGNSGGPLFNARGEVVGINSLIFSRTGGYEGLSFAIPIDVAQRIEAQIVAHGHAAHGSLGVEVQEVDQTMADAFRLPGAGGVVINGIVRASAADKAGLRVGDVIVRADGRPIAFSGDLPAILTMALPGQHIALEVWRDAALRTVVATLGDAADDAVPRKEAPDVHAEQLRLGLSLRPPAAAARRATGSPAGLVVASATGESRAVGIVRGDVLLSVNGRAVSSIDQVRRMFATEDKAVALLIQRGSRRFVVAIRVG
ncbi:MAG: trypsin-like peptidase domain-containing protein [Lautropia sp.]